MKPLDHKYVCSLLYFTDNEHGTSVRSERALTDISESPEMDETHEQVHPKKPAEDPRDTDKLDKPVTPLSERPEKLSPNGLERPELTMKPFPSAHMGSIPSINGSTSRAETPTTSIDIAFHRSVMAKSKKKTFKAGSHTGEKDSHCSALSIHSLLHDSMLDLHADVSDDGFHHQGHTVISPIAIPTQALPPSSQPKDIDRKHTGRFSVSPVDGAPICHSIRNRHDRNQTMSESSVGQSVRQSPEMPRMVSREPSVQFKMSDMSLIPDQDKDKLQDSADQKPLLMDYLEAGCKFH